MLKKGDGLCKRELNKISSCIKLIDYVFKQFDR